MSLPSTQADFAFSLAPHNLHGSVYNAQGSCSDYLIPPNTIPIVFDSAYYPSVDCQGRAFYETPREVTGASGSLGVFGGYKNTMSTEPQSPVGPIGTGKGLPPLGKPMPQLARLNYFGCPM